MHDVVIESPPGRSMADVLTICELVSLHSTADVGVVFVDEYLDPPAVYHPITGELLTPGVNQGRKLLLRFPERAARLRDKILSQLMPPHAKRGNRLDRMSKFAGDVPVITETPGGLDEAKLPQNALQTRRQP